MKLFNRLVCIALLFSIAMSPVIRVSLISLHKCEMRSLQKRKLHLEHAEILWLKKSQLAQVKAGKEIYWSGNKYDIIAVEDRGDYWQLTAINDIKEKQLEDLLDGGKDGIPKPGKPVVKLVVYDWIAFFSNLPQPQNGRIWQLNYAVNTELSAGSRTPVFRPPILG